ncbi:MAG: hypothetical protein GY927_02840 [bacterium]|nr:hypothetical protein [bacterium]
MKNGRKSVNSVTVMAIRRTTSLLGAIVNSKSGNLKLDTDFLIFDNLSDLDRSYSVNASVSFDGGAGVSNPWDGTAGFSYHNVEAFSFATIGAGDINVRHNANHSLEGLNRDTNNIGFERDIAAPG